MFNMATQAYTAPVLIKDKTALVLDRIRLDKDVQFHYNEAWLQNFLFENHLRCSTPLAAILTII